MESMFKKHVKKEQHLPDQSSESSQSSSLTNLETKNSGTTTENRDSMFQEEITGDQPSIAHEQDVESNLSTDLSFEEIIPQHGPSDTHCLEEKHVDSTSSENNGVCGANMDKMQEISSGSLNDKEKVIKLLVDEVNFLLKQYSFVHGLISELGKTLYSTVFALGGKV